LTINGCPASQTLLGLQTDHDHKGETRWPVVLKQENLLGIKHPIYLRPDQPDEDFSLTVPAGNYFLMGDN
ncbi:S26 family signal peptidase, partial [Staphylococcus aureus]|nr:S26 family signal peptidase [Staphylococcus aureus]